MIGIGRRLSEVMQIRVICKDTIICKFCTSILPEA